MLTLKFPLKLMTCVVLGIGLNGCHAPSTEDLSEETSPRAVADEDNLDSRTFANPIVAGGADPWVIYHEGYYYYCTADGNASISVGRSTSLLDIGRVARKRVWTAQPGTDHSTGTWAAELHFLDGRWYIYYAATGSDNAGHRMFVLESSTDDALGAYTFKGKLATATDRWAIDGTVLEQPDGQRYFVWSGWDGFNDYQQNLYIAPMINPWTLVQPDQPILRVEAEAATLNHVMTRKADLASGQTAVSRIDFIDSFVEFAADVPKAGSYQIDIRYANGTAQTSTHHILVNGKAASDARYQPVGWENFQTAQVFVELKAGVNSIRLSKGEGYAELDRFEVKPKGSDRVVLSMPEFSYEKQGGPAYVNEGPEALQRNGRIHLIYSASGSWTDDYQLVDLAFQGGDILNKAQWMKRGSVFARTADVFGPGHASFTKSPDQSEDWIVYHAAKHQGSGWDRDVRTQRFTFDADDNPVFGQPVSPGTPLTIPSGTL